MDKELMRAIERTRNSDWSPKAGKTVMWFYDSGGQYLQSQSVCLNTIAVLLDRIEVLKDEMANLRNILSCK